MSRQLTPAERIERFRRCCSEHRPIHTPDAWCVLEQLDELRRRRPPCQQPRRSKNERNADLVELADMICPGLPPRQAARALRHAIEHERQALPRAALECLKRLEFAGLPRTDRQRANVLAVVRNRNKQEI